MKKMSLYDICKFCYSNGEAEAQCRSHQLKNSSGLVTCPVLRSFTCTICKATGDFAHTQRYCPLNKDGQFNTGASLTDLKKKKNAAGNFPNMKRMPWSTTSHTSNTASKSPFTRKGMSESPDKFKMNPSQVLYPMMTDPLPSYYRPPFPPTTQLTMYHHYQYVNYCKQQQILHQAEMKKFEALHMAAMSSTPSYVRNFSSPMSLSPPDSLQDKFIFPEVNSNNDAKLEEQGEMKDKKKVVGMYPQDALGMLLAELREGTMAMDV